MSVNPYASQIIDPAIGDKSLNNMGLSPQELASLSNTVDPSTVVNEYAQKDIAEQAAIERYELERIQRENEQLNSQLNQVQGTVQQMTGQLTAMQQAQIQAQQAQQQQLYQNQLNSQYSLTDEQRAEHADILPVLDTVLDHKTAQLEHQFQARLEQEKAQWQQEATEPLQQQLQQTQQQIAIQEAREKSRFSHDLIAELQAIGLPPINELVNAPEYRQKYSQPLYPGAIQTWGETLAGHVERLELGPALGLLKELATQQTAPVQQQDNSMVPTAGSPPSPAPALGAQSPQSANLQKREELLAIYRARMVDANRGTYPRGMDRNQYKAAQAALLNQIDSIPTT